MWEWTRNRLPEVINSDQKEKLDWTTEIYRTYCTRKASRHYVLVCEFSNRLLLKTFYRISGTEDFFRFYGLEDGRRTALYV